MGQHRPVGTGDFAALKRLLPKLAYRLERFRLVEPVDRRAMTAIEDLVQNLAALALATGRATPVACTSCSLAVAASA